VGRSKLIGSLSSTKVAPSVGPSRDRQRSDTDAGFFTVRKTEETHTHTISVFQTCDRKVLAVTAPESSLRARIVLLEMAEGRRKRVFSCLLSYSIGSLFFFFLRVSLVLFLLLVFVERVSLSARIKGERWVEEA
jgi:hypothetical protein